MAKLQMEQVRVCALRSQRKAVMECLQRLGVMQIESDDTPPEGFSRPDMQAQALVFDRSAQTAQQALAMLDRVAPEKKGLLASFSGKRELSEEEFAAVAAESGKVLQDCNDLLQWQRDEAELAADKSRIRVARAQLEPWLSLDIPFDFAGTRSTIALIGSAPTIYTAETLSAALAERDPELLFSAEIVSVSQGQTYAAILGLREQKEALSAAVRAIGFVKPITLTDGLPAERLQALDEQEKALAERRDELRQKMAAMADRRRAIENTADYFVARAEKYRAIGQVDHSRHAFVVSGYVPQVDAPELEAQLTALGAAVELEPADPETAPVKLRNNAFAAPAQSLTEMYAMPNVTDVDPTPLMSFFYYFFFGMMFSDAGYGLLLILGTWLMIKKCHPDKGLYNNLKLFQYCGISTFLWGLVFGGFFGDAPVAIANHYFGTNWTMPCLLDPIHSATDLMILSIALGLCQVLAGIGAKFYVLWKSGDKWGALFDCGFWIVFLCGAAVLAAGILYGGTLFEVGKWIMIGAAAGLILTQGRQKKNPIMKLLSGVISLYDVSGYVSDLMSYTRLMALGLTTGVMAQVFNQLSLMFGKSVWSLFLLIPIFVIGHAINFGLNALGSYVHTIRLQYVEMFAKFYEGGGRPFKAFAFHNKYFKLQGDKQS